MIHTGLACPVLLGFPSRSPSPFTYRTLTFSGVAFQPPSARVGVSYSSQSLPPPLEGPSTPYLQRQQTISQVGFRLLPVRSPLLGESLMLSLPWGTWMFRFPQFPSLPYLFR